jgi:hypothetical protein
LLVLTDIIGGQYVHILFQPEVAAAANCTFDATETYQVPEFEMCEVRQFNSRKGPVKENLLPVHYPLLSTSKRFSYEAMHLLRQWYHCRMLSSGMLRRVALVRTDVSEELSASFIRVTRIGDYEQHSL